MTATDERRGSPSASGVEGIFFDMPDREYREAEGINQSLLKEARTPLHYLTLKETPFEISDALLFGQLFDARIFDPFAYAKRLIIRPALLNLTTKDGKAWLEGFGSESTTIAGPSGFRLLNDGRVIATQNVVDRINGMAEALESNVDAQPILKRGKFQVSVFKRDSETGVMLKGRIDILATDDAGYTTVADVKSCEDASDEAFSKAIANFGYDCQAAWYKDLTEATYHVLIAIEKEKPHGVRVFHLDQESITAARSRNRVRLNAIADCMKTGVWPCYPPGIKTINVPRWRLRGNETERAQP